MFAKSPQTNILRFLFPLEMESKILCVSKHVVISGAAAKASPQNVDRREYVES